MRGLTLFGLISLLVMASPVYARHHDHDDYDSDYQRDYERDNDGNNGHDRRRNRDREYDRRGAPGYLLDPRSFDHGRFSGMSPDEAADRAHSKYGGRVLRVEPNGGEGRRGYRVRLESDGR